MWNGNDVNEGELPTKAVWAIDEIGGGGTMEGICVRGEEAAEVVEQDEGVGVITEGGGIRSEGTSVGREGRAANNALDEVDKGSWASEQLETGDLIEFKLGDEDWFEIESEKADCWLAGSESGVRLAVDWVTGSVDIIGMESAGRFVLSEDVVE